MLDIKIYDSMDGNAWCPGCGNFGILPALKTALAELDLQPHQVVIASGIGQAAKTPHYINANGFNGLHGRSLPAAQGIKIANKELKVIINTGDGDSYGEGGNHLIHAIRRNVDITHLVHDNQIYGLTKGQGSPTTGMGQKTSMQLNGVISEPLRPIAFAITVGCTFAARSFSADKNHLVSIIKAAINHRGYSLVDILQPCVTFNHINTYQWYRERIYYLDDSYNPKNKIKAIEKAFEWGDMGIPLGILYREEKTDYAGKVPHLAQGPALADREWKPSDAEPFMEEFI